MYYLCIVHFFKKYFSKIPNKHDFLSSLIGLIGIERKCNGFILYNISLYKNSVYKSIKYPDNTNTNIFFFFISLPVH